MEDFKKGDMVTIKKGWENSAEELEIIYVVVDIGWDGQRADITPLRWEWSIRPIETVGCDTIQHLELENCK